MNTDTNGVIYLARLHWILFFLPTLMLISVLYVSYRFPEFREASLVLAFVALFWEAMVALTYSFSSLTIKKKQVILRSGLFVRQTLDIPLSKIESIDIRQTILGTMLQYGSLVITGTGGTRQLVNFISKPLTCRRYIEQLLHH